MFWLKYLQNIFFNYRVELKFSDLFNRNTMISGQFSDKGKFYQQLQPVNENYYFRVILRLHIADTFMKQKPTSAANVLLLMLDNF